MTSRLGAILFALCVAALGAEAVVYRATHPTYPTTVLENDRLSLEYPTSWGKPDWLVNKKRDSSFVILSHHDILYQEKRAPGFDGWWDKERDVTMDISLFRGNEFHGAKEHLIEDYQKKHPRSFGKDLIIPPTLQPITVAGHDGWMVTERYMPETLDIVNPSLVKLLNPVTLAYLYFFGGQMSRRTILFPVNDHYCQIQYVLPANKIARARYERIYGRIIDSLKIKGA